MKIIANIKGCYQIGEYTWQDEILSYEFDSSDSIDFILKKTGVKKLSDLNLSEKRDWTGVNK